jgi:hypothetical protein
MAYNKTRRNKSRRNRSEGGSCGMNKNNAAMPMATMGGKRRNKTRRNKTEGGKSKKGPSDWNKKVMGVYAEMKKKNKEASFRDALVEASKRKKAGTL